MPQQTLKANEGREGQPLGDDKAWRQSFVRAMNHVALKQAAAAARERTAGGGAGGCADAASEAGQSEGAASNLSRWGTWDGRVSSAGGEHPNIQDPR